MERLPRLCSLLVPGVCVCAYVCVCVDMPV